jgi:ribosomal protein L37E
MAPSTVGRPSHNSFDGRYGTRVIDQRKSDCRRCGTRTLHNRYRWVGLWGFQVLFVLSAGCWLLWPLAIAITLLVGAIDWLRPYHCSQCGRRKWLWSNVSG